MQLLSSATLQSAVPELGNEADHNILWIPAVGGCSNDRREDGDKTEDDSKRHSDRIRTVLTSCSLHTANIINQCWKNVLGFLKVLSFFRL